MEHYWEDLPIGKENAVTYSTLCAKWRCSERQVRRILHELSCWDNGENMVLIRSSHGKGFYKTDNLQEIESYKNECSNRAKKIFLTLRKARRVLKESEVQTIGQ